ncbi:MAG: beta-N-acetylhexosaminidase [Solirubrobacterales bacterium]|nr:beta-N-acetylhexosaminidase [Solirubrobacterales bacterium]
MIGLRPAQPWQLVALAICVIGCGGGPAEEPQPPPTPEERAEARAKELTSGLSEGQLVGQRILYSLEGTTLPDAVAERLRTGRAAGVVLFERNYASPEQFAALVNQIHALSRKGLEGLPALVMVDQEGGEIRRLPAPPDLSATQMGAQLSAAETEAQGAETGVALRSFGVNVDLAPVADIGRPGGALKSEQRVFSDSPDAVAAYAVAFSEGLQSAGVASTAKHFPGFGSAQINTDYGASVVVRSQAEAEEDLVPFEALISEGVELVMLSTAIYSDLEDRPAALSPLVTDDLLRDRLGFSGVTVTDALDTPALDSFASREDVALATLGAQVDLVLYAHSTQASLDAESAALTALRTGEFSRDEMGASAERVLELKALLDQSQPG